MSESKPKGLRLTLGGAPDVPHTIPNVPGVYRPNRPAPVGGPGELDVDAAKQLHDEKTVPLELVDIAGKDIPKLREQAQTDLLEAKQGNLDNARSRKLAEREQAKEQAASIEGSAA